MYKLYGEFQAGRQTAGLTVLFREIPEIQRLVFPGFCCPDMIRVSGPILRRTMTGRGTPLPACFQSEHPSPLPFPISIYSAS